jgi:hypothetical protein
MPSGLEELVGWFYKVAVDAIRLRNEGKTLDLSAGDEYMQKLEALFSALPTQSRWLKENFVRPIEKRMKKEKEEVIYTAIYQRLVEMGVFDSLLRDIVEDLRKNIQVINNFL